ncbi:hypothetical protein [Streptomyces sp. ME19-01-6]|uniref:hypothetical protein n=1 Tax=Streptomyces sp. ME19-01-6 TaxID=3028686 RepID=UPI0029AA9B02|nr:hypothetical protein [Streptomyces sp. ME19-01-6]MDX3227277.1 hypothetical protein [Streptomyces sp. ME19-01-6]
MRPHETRSAAGLLNAVQQLGATLGIAVLGTTFFHSLAPLHSLAPAGSRAASEAAQHALWVAVGLITAATVTAALMRGPRE